MRSNYSHVQVASGDFSALSDGPPLVRLALWFLWALVFAVISIKGVRIFGPVHRFYDIYALYAVTSCTWDVDSVFEEHLGSWRDRRCSPSASLDPTSFRSAEQRRSHQDPRSVSVLAIGTPFYVVRLLVIWRRFSSCHNGFLSFYVV